MLPKLKKDLLQKGKKKKSGWELMNERYHFNIKATEFDGQGNPTECVLPDIDPFDIKDAMNKFLSPNGGVKRTHLDRSGNIKKEEEKRYLGAISKKDGVILRKKYLNELGLSEDFKFKYEDEEVNEGGKNN